MFMILCCCCYYGMRGAFDYGSFQSVHLTGILLEATSYLGTCLLFGLWPRPFLFNRFAKTIHWTLDNNYGASFLLHYLNIPLSSLASYCMLIVAAWVIAASLVIVQTINVYLAGIRLTHIEHALPDPREYTLKQLVCCGISHQQGGQLRPRLPITINNLCTL